MKLNIMAFVLDSRCVSHEQYHEYSVQLLEASSYLTDYMVRALNTEIDFDCRRINFLCTTGKPYEGIHVFDSVHEIAVPIDMCYFSFSPAEKEKYLFNLLTYSLEKLCKLKGWDTSPVRKHLTALHDTGFQIEFYVDKMRSRKGKITAKVFCVHTMFAASFYIDFCDQNAVLQRKPLFVTSPHTLDYGIRLGKLEWMDDKTVVLHSKRTWLEDMRVTMDV